MSGVLSIEKSMGIVFNDNENCIYSGNKTILVSGNGFDLSLVSDLLILIICASCISYFLFIKKLRIILKLPWNRSYQE